MSMKIVYCNREHSQLWDSFLQNHESASFYHLFGWKEINERSFGHKTFYLAAMDGKRVLGVFPMVYVKSRLFGRILCSMPFVNFGGPCSLNAETENLLLQEAVSIVNKYHVDYLEIRGLYKLDKTLPTSEHKISLTIELSSDPEIIWKAFSTKHRNDIRRAYKKGLEIKVGGYDMLDVFYKVLSESWRDLGTPIYKKKYFEDIVAGFPDLIKIFVVYHQDVPVATAFNGYYKNTVEGMWAGILTKFRQLHPTYVLYWEMIRHACKNGFTNYHLGRTSVHSGGEFFKKKWHAETKQLYWQYYMNGTEQIPQLNVQNPKYHFAINAWRKIPIKLTELIGPSIARCIP